MKLAPDPAILKQRAADAERVIAHYDDVFLHKKPNLTWQILRDMNPFVPVDHSDDGLVEFV